MSIARCAVQLVSTLPSHTLWTPGIRRARQSTASQGALGRGSPDLDMRTMTMRMAMMMMMMMMTMIMMIILMK
eukprot:11896865-Karenia_brevis.AAC.1